MQVKSIAECSKSSIRQYFRPSLSYQLLLRSLFGLFVSGCFTQALLYCVDQPQQDLPSVTDGHKGPCYDHPEQLQCYLVPHE